MIHEYKNENNLITKIHFVLNTEWGIKVTSDNEMLPINEREVQRINESGFGEVFRLVPKSFQTQQNIVWTTTKRGATSLADTVQRRNA